MLASRVVGRDVEIGVLNDAFARAIGGHGGVLFLAGEPGIGKSRLTQVTIAAAQSRDLPVLRGRAVTAAVPAAYRPLAEALCSAVRDGVVSDEPDLRPFRSILGWLVPDWRGDEAPAVDPMMALAEAVLRFLRVAARGRGCVMVLEDLHWADPETLRIIEYLADNLDSERVLCLATVRDEDPSAGLELARALHARRVSRLVRLSRLGPPAVTEMVVSCLGHSTVPGEVLDLARRADGVPFLVEELLAEAVTSGALVAAGQSWSMSKVVEPIVPFTFSDSLRRRLDAFGDHTRKLLFAAAVLGRQFDWRLLPSITGRSREEVLAALHDAVDAHIVSISREEPTFRFRHALSRDAVLGELLPPEVAALSRRALDAVEASHPDLEEGWCELAADLAERAGDTGRAGRLLLESARRALHSGALASAEVTLDRANRLLPADDPTRMDVDECRSQVLAHAGKHDRALEVGDSLLARLGDDDEAAHRRAELYLSLARAAVAATRWDEAHGLMERARAEMAVTSEAGLAARVDAVAAQIAIIREPDDAPTLAERALQAAELLNLPDVACEALEVLGRNHRRHDLAAAEVAFTRALAIAKEHSLSLWRARALHELGTIDMLRGRPVARLEEARNLAVVQGALATAAVVDVQIAAALVFRDDPEPAAIATQRSAQLARKYGLHQTLAAATALEAHVHARAGRRDAMQRCIDEARALAPGVPDMETKNSFATAVLAFVHEDRSAARRHLDDAVNPKSSGAGSDYSVTPGAGMLALVRQLDGTADETAVVAVAADAVHFIAGGYFRYAQAVAAGRAGDGDRAIALMAEGDRRLGDHEWLRQLGRRLSAEAAIADGWGDPIAWLREALAFFDKRGEDRIASACRSLLRKAGVAVPRRRGDEAVPAAFRALGVTSREFEVLRLLAAGPTNKEIGTRLYLSPRTVERHVANLSVKTGVNRRSELVAYAARTISDAPSVRDGLR